MDINTSSIPLILPLFLILTQMMMMKDYFCQDRVALELVRACSIFHNFSILTFLFCLRITEAGWARRRIGILNSGHNAIDKSNILILVDNIQMRLSLSQRF